jgi:two-component system, LuxR family, sensor kinase FixL
MNWMSLIWPMMAGTCLTLACIHLRLSFERGVKRMPHIYFVCAALAVGVISCLELELMRTTDVETYNSILSWASLPIAVMVISVTGYVATFMRAGHHWLAIMVVVLISVAEGANFFLEGPMVRYATSLHQQETWGGVTFTLPTYAHCPLVWIEVLAVIALIIFIADSTYRFCRQGGSRRAILMGGSLIFFQISSRGHAMLVENGIIHSPYLVSFSFIGVILTMGSTLANGVLDASRLSTALQETERKVDLASRASQLGFWTWDLTLDQIWANDVTRDLFGVSSTIKINSEVFHNSLHPEDLAEVSEAIATSRQTGNEYACTYRICLPSGAIRWIAARGRPSISENGHEFMHGVVMDVTSHRESTRELESVRGQLAHSSRVSLMGQMAASLAHELNQPLGAILRNAETAEILLTQGNLDTVELAEIVRDIRQDDQRAGAVIDRMRAMLKTGHLQMEQLSVHELLGEAMALVRAEAKTRGITLRQQLPPHQPVVMADRVQLLQVLLNLLLNSMDAMKENSEDSPKEVLLGATLTDEGRNIKIHVQDTGCGMTTDQLARVFEPFYTTKSHGMGLGLGISADIVAAHDSELRAISSHGQGSTFYFVLPCQKETVHQ